jgi:hypothetical protein
MTLRPFLFLSLCLFLFVQTAAQSAAQSAEGVDASQEEKEKAQKELENKAVALLNDVLIGASQLRLVENRLLIQAQAADLLWERDEKRARATFREVMTSIAEALGNSGARNARRDRSSSMLAQLRTQVAMMVSARDPQLALDLVRETRYASNRTAEDDRSMRDEDSRLEQLVAAQSAARNPKLALQVAEESLKKGVTFGAFNTLLRLQSQDAEAATRLANLIVTRLQGENLSSNHEAMAVSVQLLGSVLRPQTQQQFLSGVPVAPSDNKFKPLVLDDQGVRDLANLVVTAALDTTRNGRGFFVQLQPLLPEIEKRLPGRTTQLRARMTELTKSQDPRERAWMQIQTVLQSGSPEAIIEAAAKAPEGARENAYSTAAMKFLEKGDTERARQIVSDNIRGPERERLLGIIDAAAIARAIETGSLDAAKRTISAISSREKRAEALAQLATQVATKGDKKSALGLLDEAFGLISRRPENVAEVEALLQVARSFALVEPSRAFELLDPMVEQANELLAAAALLAKFDTGEGAFKSGEMVLQAIPRNSSVFYRDYLQALTALARADFERTMSVADRFQRDEVRLMARLMIAESVLSNRPAMMNIQIRRGGVMMGMSEPVIISQ